VMRLGIEKVLEFYKFLNLCQESYRVVREEHEKKVQTKAGKSSISLGWLLISVTTLAFFGFAVLTVHHYVWDRNAEDWTGTMVGGGITMLFLIPIFLWGVGAIMNGYRDRAIFQHGISVKARILESQGTGIEVNGIPQFNLSVELSVDPPIKSQLAMLVPVEQMALIQPGTFLAVRYYSKDPSKVVLDQ
jgi:hypothetical protein